jgi:ABC-2 type transport system ATP-binding protein
MSKPQVVTVRGLRKAYGSRVVVDGLDLDVPAGEIVGLIGANGAGKTTTVECIQGLRRPDAGSLRVLGYDPMTQAGELRALIGSQLQDSALPDRLRVAEAIELLSTPQARDGGELLERFGLAQRHRSAFSTLSGGERQRLFLVLALLNRPRLVILDELTQGLDPAARRNVWDAVRRLHDDGTTVLLVTHEMDEAEALCGQVVVMRAGRVLDAGAPADLVQRHASTATIRFSLPDPPPGLLDQVRRLDGVREVERAGRQITVTGHRRVTAYVANDHRGKPAAAARSGGLPSPHSPRSPRLGPRWRILARPPRWRARRSPSARPPCSSGGGGRSCCTRRPRQGESWSAQTACPATSAGSRSACRRAGPCWPEAGAWAWPAGPRRRSCS